LFWKLKFFKDYWPINNYTGSWKKLYEGFMNVWVCGNNGYGQLGISDDEEVLTQIPNFKAKQVSVGKFHTVVLDLNNNIWTFGRNESGQLGLGDYQDPNVPTEMINLKGSYINTPTIIPNLKAQQVSANRNHTVVLDLENNIWTFGDNESRQLGLGDNKDRNVPTQIPNLKAKQISTGGFHTVVIDLEDNVWTFGHNYWGQLGLGDNNRRYIPTQIPKFKAKQVSAGEGHTVVIDLEDNIWTLVIINLDN
jgi:alpha-tubulin suppressor-like RCC1 family protein